MDNTHFENLSRWITAGEGEYEGLARIDESKYDAIEDLIVEMLGKPAVPDEEYERLQPLMKDLLTPERMESGVGISLWNRISQADLGAAKRLHRVIAKHFLRLLTHTKVGQQLPQHAED